MGAAGAYRCESQFALQLCHSGCLLLDNDLQACHFVLRVENNT